VPNADIFIEAIALASLGLSAALVVIVPTPTKMLL
jgi:hypothetical protein